jgi:peptidoglycan/xylan/chitin deacetylase (PgdA/CDA1 family)
MKNADAATTAKRWARIAIGGLFLYTGAVWLRQTVSRLRHRHSLRILLYHRVNDLPGDPEAVRTADFEAQMRHVSETFNVVSLTSVIGLAKTGAQQEAVAITFDDGYQDNFAHAVPILRRYGMPACFFVTTDYVGTDRCFPWDVPGPVAHPKLTWDELRQMDEMGFDMGAHTCSHPNLAQLSGRLGGREILDSKARLGEELGREVRLFATPFGKRGDMNPQLRQVIQDNFDICCNNIRGRILLSDLRRYDLHRIAVQQWWSLFDFKRELEGVFDFLEWFRR